jgi:hypothetical protein
VIDFRIYKNGEITDQLKNCSRLTSHMHEVRYPERKRVKKRGGQDERKERGGRQKE